MCFPTFIYQERRKDPVITEICQVIGDFLAEGKISL